MDKIAVLFGRFQKSGLDEFQKQAHRYLSEQGYVSIFCAVLIGEAQNTSSYPMPFDIIRKGFSTFGCFPIVESPHLTNDCETMDIWIRGIKTPNNNVTIFELEPDLQYVGKHEVSEDLTVYDYWDSLGIGKIWHLTPAYRQGMIDGCKGGYPETVAVVDIAVVCNGFLLLGQKKGRPQMCFPGGFIDPDDDTCAEETVAREVLEETGLKLESGAPIKYLKSHMTSDFRKVNDKDKIMTIFYLVDLGNGKLPPVKGADDLESCKWCDLNLLREESVIPGHRVLLNTLKVSI